LTLEIGPRGKEQLHGLPVTLAKIFDYIGRHNTKPRAQITRWAARQELEQGLAARAIYPWQQELFTVKHK
jgi:hypothetical protein